jgi:hypothetical protein
VSTSSIDVHRPSLIDCPSEILLHIFSYLPSYDLINGVAPTCQHFAQLILHHLVCHLDLSSSIDVVDVPHLFQHAHSLKSLTLINWENQLSILTYAIWFDLLSRRTRSIESIRFFNVLLCPILISLVMEYFPHCLQTIVFDYQKRMIYDKFDLILCLMASTSCSLKRVTASHQIGITHFGILQLVTNLSAIIELNLMFVEAITDE